MVRFIHPLSARRKLVPMLCALVPLLCLSCGGGNAAWHKPFIDELNAEIGFATLDDLVSEMGPPHESIVTPEGTWYIWRQVSSAAAGSAGFAVGSGGFAFGLSGVTMGAPAETGKELSCLFDRKTGRLSDYRYREW